MVLSYGIVNWVTYGIFLGQRQVYATPQTDDMFLANGIFEPTDSCVAPVYDTEYRVTAADMTAFLAWQQATRANPKQAGYRTTIPYNAYGPDPDTHPVDDLTPYMIPGGNDGLAAGGWVGRTVGVASGGVGLAGGATVGSSVGSVAGGVAVGVAVLAADVAAGVAVPAADVAVGVGVAVAATGVAVATAGVTVAAGLSPSTSNV